MSKPVLSLDSVWNAGLALPGVVAGVHYGASALKLNGRMLACRPVNRSAELNSIVLSVGVDCRARLLKARPDLYYVTDHYAPHPVILLRLSCVSRGELARTLKEAWEHVSSLKAAAPRKAPRKRGAQGSRASAR
jgi:hypothetical protein